MKKIIILSIFLAAGNVIQSQTNESELKSRKGQYILPQSGDWGLGVGSNSIFNYLGSMFTPSNQSPLFDFPMSEQTIQGKYFRERNFAYRVAIRISAQLSTTNNYTPSLFPDAEPGDLVVNSEKVTQIGNIVRAGFEKRRGTGRLQGIYGAELVVGYFQGENRKFIYGNPIEYQPVLARTTKVSNGNTFTVGLSGFAGIEYFFAPKISIGGEFHWGPQYSSVSGSTMDREVWNSTDNISEITTVNISPGSTSLLIDNSTLGGLIKLMFYF